MLLFHLHERRFERLERFELEYDQVSNSDIGNREAGSRNRDLGRVVDREFPIAVERVRSVQSGLAAGFDCSNPPLADDASMLGFAVEHLRHCPAHQGYADLNFSTLQQAVATPQIAQRVLRPVELYVEGNNVRQGEDLDCRDEELRERYPKYEGKCL